MISASALPCDLLPLGFGLLDNGRPQLHFATLDLSFLHAGFGLDADLLDLHLLGDDLLLLHVGFDLIRLVSRGFLHLDRFEVVGPFHLQVALGFGLTGLAGGFGDDLFLLGFRLGDARIATGLGAANGGVPGRPMFRM